MRVDVHDDEHEMVGTFREATLQEACEDGTGDGRADIRLGSWASLDADNQEVGPACMAACHNGEEERGVEVLHVDWGGLSEPCAQVHLLCVAGAEKRN